MSEEIKSTSEVKKSNAFATVALVVGIVAAVFGWTGVFGLILAIIAIIFAILALVKRQSKAKAIWGLVLGIVAMVTAIIVISVAAAVIDALDENGTASTSSSEKTAETTFTVGQVIDFDNKKVTVTSAERNWQSGNEYITPDSGNEFVKVQVTIENNSDDQISYNTFDWKMQDSMGVIKDVDVSTFGVDGALSSGQLAPNGKISGFMVFEVPSGDSGLVISYNPAFFSDKKIEIKL